MRRLLVIAVPAVLLLGAPVPVAAKGILSAKVCGSNGCRTIPKAHENLLEGGAPVAAPKRREPFVRLDVRVGVPGHTERMRQLFLPGSELVLADDGITWMQPLALAELRVIAARVKPFPARALPASALETRDPAAAPTAGSGKPLPPQVFGATAAPAAATSAGGSAPPSAATGSSSAAGGGLDAWWLALPAAAVLLGAGVVWSRRRRRRPPATAAPPAG